MQDPFENTEIYRLLSSQTEPSEAEMRKAQRELSENPEYLDRILESEWQRCQANQQPASFLRDSGSAAHKLVTYFFVKIDPLFTKAQLKDFATNPNKALRDLSKSSEKFEANLNKVFGPFMKYFGEHQEEARNKSAETQNDWRLGFVKPAIFFMFNSVLNKSIPNNANLQLYVGRLQKLFNANASPNEKKISLEKLPDFLNKAADFVEKQLNVRKEEFFHEKFGDARREKMITMANDNYQTKQSKEKSDLAAPPTIEAALSYGVLYDKAFKVLTQNVELDLSSKSQASPAQAQPILNSSAPQQIQEMSSVNAQPQAPTTIPPQAAGMRAAVDRQMNNKVEYLMTGIEMTQKDIISLNQATITDANASNQCQQCEVHLNSILNAALSLDNPLQRLGGDDSTRIINIVDSLSTKMAEILKSPNGTDNAIVDTVNRMMEKLDQARDKGLVSAAVHENLTSAITEKVSQKLI